MARCPLAEWHGDNIPNETHGKMYAHKGLVLHIIDGTLPGADSWFHNPKAQVSAHFGIGRDGRIVQWVDTDDTAWAEVAGNHYWLSVENEGVGGQPLTQPQEESAAKLFAWVVKTFAVPCQPTADPERPGLGHHSMGGAYWGGHDLCPGQRVIDQKPYIVHRAGALLDFPAPHPKPKPKPPEPAKTPDWYRRVLRVERPVLLTGDDVKHVQRKVHVREDGFYGPDTAAKVRGFQKLHNLTADGVVGPATAKELK